MFEALHPRHWQIETARDGIVVLTLDRPGESANSLSRAVLNELAQIVERIAIEAPKGLIIRSGKPSGFIVGADIREFEEYARKDQVLDAILAGHRVFDALATLPCPTVAAIHGVCMGGGTELSLACSYRVASDDPKTRIGLPEVLLGIQPGWGGSARLPHLIGAIGAFDMMLTGRALSASAARALGLVDKVVEVKDLLDAARELIRRRPGRPVAQRLRAWASNTWPARQLLAIALNKQVARKADRRHYPAPYAMIDVWRRHGGSVGSMLRAEPSSVAKLAATPTAQNLVRVFFLQEALKAQGRKDGCGIERVHVVGAGVMGGDIAAWCALQGFQVSLQDREIQYVERALGRAQTLLEKKLKTPARVAEARARLIADVNGANIAAADLVIEAIFENVEAKQSLYRHLESVLKPDAIIATNTSSIPLTTLREGLARPQNFLGLHYFNPVAMMPLVEVVRHDGLDPAVLARTLGFARAIDKLPVVTAPTPGFLVNRILMPYLLEAITAYAEGIPGPVLDHAAKSFGMPMGPIELADTVGLDVAASVGRILADFLGLPIPAGLESLLASGKRGKKDGQGFYTWTDGKPVKPKVPKGYQAPDDLVDRLILPMVNEAVACWAEGVVDGSDLLDAGVIFGTGFAPFRGGPLHYARNAGPAALKARLEALAMRYGARFAPKAGWDRLIEAKAPRAAA